MKEGFWTVAYESSFGFGLGMLALETGIAVGADVLGGIWDGTYKFDQRNDVLDVHLTVRFPPSVTSTVSGNTTSDGHHETYQFSLPNELEREHTIILRLQDQPMAVQFRKIRDFP